LQAEGEEGEVEFGGEEVGGFMDGVEVVEGEETDEDGETTAEDVDHCIVLVVLLEEVVG
jgi:hypothetical protein